LPALKGKKRCRLHGGLSPGAPKSNRNAWKHGGYSAKTKAAARYLKAMAGLVLEQD
jgi:glucans biosynthesis protein